MEAPPPNTDIKKYPKKGKYYAFLVSNPGIGNLPKVRPTGKTVYELNETVSSGNKFVYPFILSDPVLPSTIIQHPGVAQGGFLKDYWHFDNHFVCIFQSQEDRKYWFYDTSFDIKTAFEFDYPGYGKVTNCDLRNNDALTSYFKNNLSFLGGRFDMKKDGVNIETYLDFQIINMKYIIDGQCPKYEDCGIDFYNLEVNWKRSTDE